MSTIVEGDFEWDSRKAASNVAKHGISFAEAATVFADPMAVYLDDGSGTERMVVIGSSCVREFFTSCMCSEANVTGLSVRAGRHRQNATFMNWEVTHE